MISYQIRYNWAYVSGAVKVHEEFRGMAYDEMVNIALDEVDEMVLALTKSYNIPYLHLMDEMYYSDLTVLYAKYANEQSFSRYNEYASLSEESKGKYVTDYGVPKPYVYSILNEDVQRKNIEEQGSKLKQMYRHGGRLND